MKRFNFSDWGLRHQQLVLFLIVVLTLVGALAYTHLGQSEDPPFTFKVMVIKTMWPGASAREVEQQVTDKIEKKILQLGETDFIRSYSQPGESTVLLVARDSLPSTRMPELFYQIRKRVGDIAYTLPQGVQGPFFQRRVRRHLRQYPGPGRRRDEPGGSEALRGTDPPSNCSRSRMSARSICSASRSSGSGSSSRI